jgi:CheY-like chemotaxis protein
MNPSSQQFKILAVDDSPIYRKLVEQSLSQERYTLLFAKDGREALDLFAKHQPAVVITDWTMPDIEGLELCRRVRSDFQGVYSHLILLTSNADKEQVVEGLAAGADDYLTKPFHPGELLARVAVGRRIVELHREIQVKNRSLEELALTSPEPASPTCAAACGCARWQCWHFLLGGEEFLVVITHGATILVGVFVLMAGGVLVGQTAAPTDLKFHKFQPKVAPEQAEWSTNSQPIPPNGIGLAAIQQMLAL